MNRLSQAFEPKNPATHLVVLGEPSLADAMAAIAADTNIPTLKRRHWLTSMRRIADGMGRPPGSLPCRMTALRHHVNRLNAAALGWELKTLSSHKSNLKAAINHYMKMAHVPSRGAPLSTVWAPLMQAIFDVKPRRLLSGIARHCSARDLRPESVNEALVDQYFEFRAETTFQDVGPALKRELMKAWNECVEKVSGWPQQLLTLPDLPTRISGPDWAEFPQGLREEIDAYLGELAKPHRSANGRRRRPCKATTVATRRRELIAFIRSAVGAGKPIHSLTSLAAVLQPDVVTASFEQYLDRNGANAKGYTIDLAWKLHAIAQMLNMSPECIAHLDEIRGRLEEDRGPVLTEKNNLLIRQVMTSDVWSNVTALPETLMAKAQLTLKRAPQKAATLACLALQIQLLTVAPVRIGNLLSIRLGYNLKRIGQYNNNYRLHFPNYDVKNRIDLDFPFGVRTSNMIDKFIIEFRPHFGQGQQIDWLFPRENGEHRSSSHASVAIAALLERDVGLRVTAHQFRHAAAAMILKAEPGNYEFARRVLGHRNIATTQRFYTSLESFPAAKMFGEMMEEQTVRMIDRRAAAKKLSGPKKLMRFDKSSRGS